MGQQSPSREPDSCAQLAKHCLQFMAPQGSSPLSQESATCPCAEPDESTVRPSLPFM